MNDLFCKSALPVALLASTVLFSGCATQGKPPPTITVDADFLQGRHSCGRASAGSDHKFDA